MEDDGARFDRDLVRGRVRAGLFGEARDPPVVGRYRVERRIGSGAMGVVYAARDPHLDRRVALKLAKPGATTERQMARSVREAQALARLSHPNVVTVFDAGVHDGRLFVAMELVEGQPLGEWVARRRPSWREIVDVMGGAARGLGAAHAQGLVHRDFKPDNVLVAEGGVAKVVDFGLVRPAEILTEGATQELRDRPLEVRLTESMAVIGTPAYMAPEQLEGREVDARADQYALCAVLYEALYGRLPHPADNLGVLLESVLEGAPRPPPPDSPVPAHVRLAILRGLSRHPEDRFGSMEALIDALAPAPVEPGRSPAPWLVAGCVALGVAALAVGGGVALYVGRGGSPAGGPVASGPTAPSGVAGVDDADAGAPAAAAADAASPPARPKDAGAMGQPDAGPPPERPRRPRPVVRPDPDPDPDPEPPPDPEPEPDADPDELETGFFVRDVVRRCWRGYQDEHPDATTTPVTVNIDVAPSGDVTAISADSFSDVPGLLECIETRGADWQGFPRHERSRHAQDLVLLRPR